MKKVCDNWSHLFPSTSSNTQLFEEFRTRATNVSAEVIRVQSSEEAIKALTDLIESVNAKKIVAVSCPLQQSLGLYDDLSKMDLKIYTDKEDIAEHAETADIGISGVEFGIAETGSVCQDAYAIEGRLVSALTPIHVAFLNSSHILPGVQDAFDVISQIFHQGYISFITGPSRTADIERVLTIGVHGPSRLIIIAVDPQAIGGVA